MGFNINEKPDNITGKNDFLTDVPFDLYGNYLFNNGDTNPATTGRVILLFFKEVKTGESWTWISTLNSYVAAHGTSNFKIAAILYDSTGIIDGIWLNNQLSGKTVNFTILMDGTYLSSISKQFFDNFGGVVTTPFCYLISKNCRICEKILGTVTDAVISNYLQGPSYTLYPAATGPFSNLTEFNITFAEAVSSAVTGTSNFTVSGARGTLPVNPVSSVPVSGNEYRVTLGTGTQSPVDGDLLITMSTAITDRVFYTPVPVREPVITYKIDRTVPVVKTFTTPTLFPASGAIDFTITADNAGDVVKWAVTELPTPPPSGDSRWKDITTSGSSISQPGSINPGASGYRNIYAWLKDSAGNVSELKLQSYLSFCFYKNPWTGVLVRDYMQDAGNVPTMGTLCQSPDIIISKDIITDPVASFPDYQQRYGNAPHPLLRNTSYYFYIRVRNYDSTAVAEGKAAVYLYYSPATIFQNPSEWLKNAICVNWDTSKFDNPLPALPAKGAPGGDVRFNTLPFTWSPAVEAGHYCFIAVVSTDKHPWDPVNPPKFNSYPEFVSFVASNPNICWRNYDIANAAEKTSISRDYLIQSDLAGSNNPVNIKVDLEVHHLQANSSVVLRCQDLGINKTKTTTGELKETVSTDYISLRDKREHVLNATVTIRSGRFDPNAKIIAKTITEVETAKPQLSGRPVPGGMPRFKPVPEIMEKFGKGIYIKNLKSGTIEAVMGTYTTYFALPERPPVMEKPHGRPEIKPEPAPRVKAEVKPAVKAKTAGAKKAEPAVKAKAKPAEKKAVTGKAAVKKTAAVKAVIKKAVSKKTAVKKTVIKKAAVKKTAAKKPVVKKAVVKKAAVRKAAVKKPVVKKVAVKKTVIKKAAAKKAAVKKPVVKKAAVKKTAVKKPAVKKTQVKKTVKKPVVKTKK